MNGIHLEFPPLTKKLPTVARDSASASPNQHPRHPKTNRGMMQTTIQNKLTPAMRSMRTRSTPPPSAARCNADIPLFVTAQTLAPLVFKKIAKSRLPDWQAIKSAVYP